MAKRLSISVPDDLFEKLKELKDELSDSQTKTNEVTKKISRKISSICQNALREIIVEAEVSLVYRSAGKDDGRNAASQLSVKDQEHITKVWSGAGPYKKWSRIERVNELQNQYYSHDSPDFITPRFSDLYEGKIILDDWVESDPEIAEDRRGHASWSYVEGYYEGIYEVYTNKNED